MAFEWVAGLFQGDNQQTRGLSGDSAHTVALDDSNPYYNYRLRRHQSEGDLIADPGLLWYTSPYVKRRSGLGTHVGAEIGDGTANYTDVLLILSREDFLRASADWQDNATRTLQQEFDNFCRRENFSRPHVHRPLGVRIVEDGSVGIGGHSLGLGRGEFVTGLLPNLYTGPARGSYPVIGVHVNLPGVWEGYQEVNRLYNDQILFTLGAHWLDNFCHPSLQQAALYRLRQYPDGSFVHIVNPDLQDQYQVTSTNQGGASVLTLATRTGQPLAYLVLAVIDPPSTRPTRPDPSRPDIQMPSAPSTPTPSQRTREPVGRPRRANDVPSIAPPMLLDDDAPAPAGSGTGTIGLGGKTIIPDAPSERVFTLQERGALLQKVHFSAFMLGYDVYLGARGELGTHVEDPAATFQIRKRSVSIVAHVDGVVVGGRPVPAGVEVPIDGDVKIEVAGQKLEYRDLRGSKVDGWPYVGEIRRPASSTYMIWGEDYQVGRSRECRVVLPDETRNDNIHWKPSVDDGAKIRARTGEIRKSRFYTDSIMVASEHATVDLRSEEPQVQCTARHCYVYVRRNDEVMPLYPATSPQQPKVASLQPGDEVLIGNCLFHVGYTPAGEAVAPAPAPRIELTSDSLASAVKDPDIRTLDEAPSEPGLPDTPPPLGVQEMVGEQEMDDEPPPPPPEEPPSEEDEPPPLPPLAVGQDSIIYEETSTSGPLGADGPIFPESDDDDPTIPGLVLPRDEWDDEGPAWGGAPPIADRHDDSSDLSVDEPAPVPPLRDDLRGWDADDDDWEEDDSLPGDEPAPRDVGAPDAPATVDTPFPDVAETQPMTPPPRDEDVDADDQATFVASRQAVRELLEEAEALDEADVVPPPPPEPPEPVAGRVVFADDAEAQFELGRPMHLILAGWAVNGEVVCGNHDGADLIIPENRIVPDQAFVPRDYFRLKLRGRRGSVTLLSPSELLVDEDDPAQETYDDPQDHMIDVIRRDDAGEEDFAVRLKIVDEKALPDPRARMVALDYDDPLAAALVTRGLPRAQPRTLEIDGISLTLFYDREVVKVSDYLDTYKRGDHFHPFFVQRQGGRFKTAPEDGATFDLKSGDRLVIGACVYVLREE